MIWRSENQDDCTRCGERLTPERSVWLELNTNTGRYHAEGGFPEGGLSQGWFPFGAACAKRVLKNGGRTDR